MTSMYRSKRNNAAVNQNAVKGGIYITLGVLATIFAVSSLFFQMVYVIVSGFRNWGYVNRGLALVGSAFLVLGIYLMISGGKRLALSNSYKKLEANMRVNSTNQIGTMANLMATTPDQLLDTLTDMQNRHFWRAVTILDDCVVIEPFDTDVAFKILADKGMSFRSGQKRDSGYFFPAFAGVLFVLSILPTSTRLLFMLIIGAIIAVIVAIVVKSVFGKKPTITYGKLQEKAPEPIVVDIKPSGVAEADTVIGSGQAYLNQLIGLQAKISHPVILGNIYDITASMQQLIELLKKNPKKYKQIRQFMEHSLPTTIKLLNTYCELNKQPVKGENINTSMKKIEDMSTMVANTFRKELDALYTDKSLDIEVDIEVMENVLTQSSNDFPNLKL